MTCPSAPRSGSSAWAPRQRRDLAGPSQNCAETVHHAGLLRQRAPRHAERDAPPALPPAAADRLAEGGAARRPPARRPPHPRPLPEAASARSKRSARAALPPADGRGEGREESEPVSARARGARRSPRTRPSRDDREGTSAPRGEDADSKGATTKMMKLMLMLEEEAGDTGHLGWTAGHPTGTLVDGGGRILSIPGKGVSS